MIAPHISAALQAKYSQVDLTRYFTFLESATGDDHLHHVAPRA